jgi:hypothetical protein
MHDDDGPGGTALAVHPGNAVALATVADDARGYVAASLAPATRRAYRTDLEAVHRVVRRAGRDAPAGGAGDADPVPVRHGGPAVPRRCCRDGSRRSARRIATPATSRRRPTRWCGERGVASVAPTAPPAWARHQPGPATCGPRSPPSPAVPASAGTADGRLGAGVQRHIGDGSRQDDAASLMPASLRTRDRPKRHSRSDAMKERGLRSPWVPEWSRLGASHSYTQEDGRPLWIDSTSVSTFTVGGR